MKNLLKIFAKYLLYIILFLIFAYCLTIFLIQPSNNRNWSLDQAVLPEINITGDTINIENIRDFRYASTHDYEPQYYSSSFPVGSVKKVWFVVEPFENRGAAHTFVTFEFEDGRFLSVSVEIRKEVGESFDVLKGVLRQYELTYVIASEDDVIKLRSNFRKDKVYLYPMKADKMAANKLFEIMLKRANDINNNPEFYNTIFNTCTTNIVDAVNEVSGGKIPYDKRITWPEDADYYAYEMGLIDTELPMDQIRDRFRINDLAMQYATSTDFSKKIRGW